MSNAIYYVHELETKLAKAGLDLVEKEKIIANQVELLEDARNTLAMVKEEIVKFKKIPGFDLDLDEEFPVVSLYNTRVFIIRLFEEIKKHQDMELDHQSELQHIGGNLTNFLSASDIEYSGEDVRGMSDKLQEAFEKLNLNAIAGEIHTMLDETLERYGITSVKSLKDKVSLIHDNAKGNRPVLVPWRVGKALEKLRRHFMDFGCMIATIMHENYQSGDYVYDWIGEEVRIVSKWRSGNIDAFYRLITHGYDFEKSEREIRNEKLDDIFKGYAAGDYTKQNAIELIEKLYESDYEVVDDGN